MQMFGEAASHAPGRRAEYQRELLAIRHAFERGASGAATARARAELVDRKLEEMWLTVPEALLGRVALIAVGGYGRRELFPFSDVDLLFLLDAKLSEKLAKAAIQRVCQQLWDLGVRAAPQTRKAPECARLNPAVPEFSLALLDGRYVAGGAELFDRLRSETLPRLIERDGRALQTTLGDLTRARYARYGDTLFHLEPNIKECPGGLRDTHVCHWMAALGPLPAATTEFTAAAEFLAQLRCFLHFRHERDDNTLDWQAQDQAAAAALGVHDAPPGTPVSAASWMRLYFRHARNVERRVAQVLGAATAASGTLSRLRAVSLRRRSSPPSTGYRIEQGRLSFDPPSPAGTFFDPSEDAETVWRALIAMAEGGARLDPASEERLSQALPGLSSHLEEGASLWRQLASILNGRFAAQTLRSMHAVGLLELLIPEFHGIDALVIRDAYHRYTVDEHTFVLIDTLHRLRSPELPQASEWTAKFAAMLSEIAHPELLLLAALLHDTGKARNAGHHAAESVRLAAAVVARLELEAYESDLVLGLIRNHLEMAATLRRDIFDGETVRAFAGKVAIPEALRLLTLFTYADINAVHPDALTPWKVENIWRLYMATSNYLDRSVDDERVSAKAQTDLVYRVLAGTDAAPATMAAFLDGFPERYLHTRSTEQVRAHFAMAQRFAEDAVQLDFHYNARLSEITLVTAERPLLFADFAGVLAAWGMNIVSADAFSNRAGIVIDTLRFTDSFKTLEMNQSEHPRFQQSVHDVVAGSASLDHLLRGRRKARSAVPRIVVQPRIDIDNQASVQSTLLQVVAQDAPGLLRELSLALAGFGCNIEVALIDTEGEMAIDVFYVTRLGHKLRTDEAETLRNVLLALVTPDATTQAE